MFVRLNGSWTLSNEHPACTPLVRVRLIHTIDNPGQPAGSQSYGPSDGFVQDRLEKIRKVVAERAPVLTREENQIAADFLAMAYAAISDGTAKADAAEAERQIQEADRKWWRRVHNDGRT